MNEQELMLRCYRLQIPYTALPQTVRRELLELLSQIEASDISCLTEMLYHMPCPFSEPSSTSLSASLAEWFMRLSDQITDFLSHIGNTEHTVSFSFADQTLSPELQNRLSEWMQTLTLEEHHLRILTGQWHEESLRLPSMESHCIRCHMSNQVIDYAILLSDTSNEELQAALSAHKAFLRGCHERRMSARNHIAEHLRLCEETLPSLLTEFRAQMADPSAVSLATLIRACETLRSRLLSLYSLKFSKIQS